MPGQWLGFGERYETSAEQVPQPWTLVCRANEVTSLGRARQWAMALEARNEALQQFAGWLVALDEPGSTVRRTISVDQIVAEARRVLALNDPLRGDE